MPAAVYTDVLQKFYLAYFGRPADPEGLSSAGEALNASGAPTSTQALLNAYDSNATVKALIDGFGNSAESQALYGGATTAARVTAIYNNVLNRGPDAGGLAYWTGEIDSGRLSLAKVSLAIFAAAENDIGGDALTVANRVTVANYFTTALDQPIELNAYTGDAAAAFVRNALATVNASTDTTAFQSVVNQVIIDLIGPSGSATIGVPSASSVTEDLNPNASGNLIATGTIPISDPIPGEAAFQASVQSAAGNLGSLILAANGSYTYTVANSAVQYLGAGQTKVDTYTVTSLDGTTKQVSFTVQGVNDTAVIGSPSTAEVTKGLAVTDGQLIATGQIGIADVDQGEARFVPDVSRNLGQLEVAADGRYTYRLANSALQNLYEGQTRTDIFTLFAVDGTTQQVAFTIKGAGTPPPPVVAPTPAVIGAPTVTTVTEDVAVITGNLVANGTILITDPNFAQAAFQTPATPAAGNLGNLQLRVGGEYAYTVANSATQYLGAGDSKIDTFTVTAIDGTTREVSFTINGTNDIAVIGEPTVSGVTEDLNPVSGNLSAIGTIAITDTDQFQAGFSTTVAAAAGNLGSLSINAAGDYTYTVANSAVQYLGAGDTKTDTFTVTSLDGTTKDVNFAVNGNNDTAVIGEPTVSGVTEDLNPVNGDLSASGTIAISDVDQNQAGFQTSVAGAQGNLGSLALQTDGNYTYTVANSAVQYLGAGQTKVDSFTIKALDGTAKDVAFTIIGANDTPVLITPTAIAYTD
ncbi:MAG: VCBS domain-containing protein, partial [Pseudomonadota bacterium]